MCERQSETHVRAQLLQALTTSALAPTGLRARREDDDQATSLRATVTISGQVAPRAGAGHRPAVTGAGSA
ncbi:hypothetical protein A6P39_004115 [Streptomyces sp. FXJ1.172]|uniref:hypothetical protein n=1 Tax=Streptomyces sp. FXJ1.172 TaxID=710705 RepID=UPI0018FE24B8|nr:hypothetical protein [Streptomyces sp. FXJ1.172]WEO93284.1 hypothetical protein A6P39_004115 [Streptomyces sp. FXJ1.172]